MDNTLAKRFKITGFLWFNTIILAIAVMGHLFEWLPPNILGGVAKDIAFSILMLIVAVTCLLRLHWISWERMGIECLFLSGLLMGVGLSFMWSINGAGVMLTVPATRLVHDGLRLIRPLKINAINDGDTLAKRLKITWGLWLFTLILAIALIGHLYSVLSYDILLFSTVEQYTVSSTLLVIIAFICLLALHCVRGEIFRIQCLFLSGLLMGIGLPFYLGISVVGYGFIIAGIQLLKDYRVH